METACGADELPPIAIGSPAGAVGRKEVVIAIAPDRAFAPGVATIAPVGPTSWAASGFPVLTGKVGLSACDGGLCGIASFEAIGARIPGCGVGVGAIADFSEGRGVAHTIDKIFGANDGCSGFASSCKVRSEYTIPS